MSTATDRAFASITVPLNAVSAPAAANVPDALSPALHHVTPARFCGTGIVMSAVQPFHTTRIDVAGSPNSVPSTRHARKWFDVLPRYVLDATLPVLSSHVMSA